jgi:hypothetical protein
MFPHLIGETIRGVLVGTHGQIYLIFADHTALVLGTTGGGGPAYWKEPAKDINRLLASRRKQLEQTVEALHEVVRIAEGGASHDQA